MTRNDALYAPALPAPEAVGGETKAIQYHTAPDETEMWPLWCHTSSSPVCLNHTRTKKKCFTTHTQTSKDI